jgi:hypothetical protein
MARSKPSIILQDRQQSKTLDVCAAQAVYAVYYRGRPIKLRTSHNDLYDGFKYLKTCFPESGHAISLARKLNQRFNTQDFAVCELRVGRMFNI